MSKDDYVGMSIANSAYGNPFIILKMVGMSPDQVAALHKAIQHPQYKEEQAFFNFRNGAEQQHKPKMASIHPPEILSSGFNKEHETYTVEIRVPILFNGDGDPLLDDYKGSGSLPKRLQPLSVLMSIFSAAGIFPSVEADALIGTRETHGQMKVIAPLDLPSPAKKGSPVYRDDKTFYP